MTQEVESAVELKKHLIATIRTSGKNLSVKDSNWLDEVEALVAIRSFLEPPTMEALKKMAKEHALYKIQNRKKV